MYTWVDVYPLPRLQLMMKIQLFVTCLVDSFFPEVGESVVELLERSGFQVEFDTRQTCCGQPPFNAGFWDDARPIAARLLDIYADSDLPLVLPSGSCAAMIRHGYLDLFQDDPRYLNKARNLASRTFELTEFLAQYAIPTMERVNSAAKLAYHPSCHLSRILNVTRQPLQLLEDHNIQYQTLESECCGFGGVFAVDHPDISSEMLQRRLEAIRQSGAEQVVACDVSCLMQLEGGLRMINSEIRCSHIAQILTGKKPGLR